MRNANLNHALRAVAAATLLMVAACSTTGTSGFQGRYLPNDIPEFKGKGQVMIVIPDGKRDFMWAGKASSWIGSDSTLVLPLGTIVEKIATDVFGTHFSGVQFVPTRPCVSGCDIAIEGDMDQFIYSYTRLIEAGFEEENQESWIVPEVEVALIARAYGASGSQILAEDLLVGSGCRPPVSGQLKSG